MTREDKDGIDKVYSALYYGGPHPRLQFYER